MSSNPRQLSNQLIYLKYPKVTQEQLDKEVRDLFANRREGLDYIYNTFEEGNSRTNALNRLNRVYPETRTLKERWDDYVNNAFSGDNTNYWNNEFIDIEKALPFKDDEEHNIWSNMGGTWMGESEWEDLTNDLIARTEPNYVDKGIAAKIIQGYKDNHPNWYK